MASPIIFDMENAVLMTMERAMKKVFKEIAAMDHVPSYEELKARYFPADASEIASNAEEQEAPKPKKEKKAAPKKKEAKPKEAESDGEAPEKGKCQGVTVKGLPCKKNAMSGCCFCSVHKPKEGDEEPKKKKEKKAAEKKGEPLEEEAFGTPPPPKRTLKIKPPTAPTKSLPVHTHEVDEEIHEDCDMCQTHGNSASGTNPKYEVAQDLKSRLASILGAIDGSDEELEEEAEALIEENEATQMEELVEGAAFDELKEAIGAVFDELEEEEEIEEEEEDEEDWE
jgi:hypothetical protein